MQQAQRLFEDREQTSSGRSSFRRSFFRSYASLRQLDVPVTEIIPEKVIECLYRFMKLITGQRTADVFMPHHASGPKIARASVIVLPRLAKDAAIACDRSSSFIGTRSSSRRRSFRSFGRQRRDQLRSFDD